MRCAADRPQVPETASPSRSSRTTASTSPSPSTRAAVGDRADDARACCCDQLGHRLVDRVGGEQVPGGDGVALADPVAAVLGLVVHRRRPVELEEGDVRGARQRDALAGDARRADDQLRAAAALERGDRAPRARCERVGAERGAARRGKRSSTALLDLEVARRTRRAARRRRGSRRSTPAPPRACRARRARCSALSCASRSARSAAAILALELAQVERLRAQPGDHVAARRAGTRASLSSATGTTTWRLARQLRQHVGLQPPHEAARGAGASAAAPRCAAPWKRRAKRAPEPNSSSRPSMRSCGDQLVGVVHHRRAGEREAQPVVRRPPRRAGAPPACASRAGSCSSATRRATSAAAARGRAASRCARDDVVVEDRDVGARRRPPPRARDDRRRDAVRAASAAASRCQLSFSDAGQTTTAGIRAVGLERGERLDGLAEPLLVGEERAAGLERVGDARALERRAARRRARRPPRGSARPSWARERRTASAASSCSAQQPLEHVARVRATSTPYVRDEVLERLEQLRVERDRAPCPRRRAAA